MSTLKVLPLSRAPQTSERNEHSLWKVLGTYWKYKLFPNTLSGHHCKSSPRDTGLWTGVLFLSGFGSPSLLVEPLSLSNEAPSSHLRSRNRRTDSRSRNSSESLSKGRRRTGMQSGHTSGIKVSHSLVHTLQDAANSTSSTQNAYDQYLIRLTCNI